MTTLYAAFIKHIVDNLSKPLQEEFFKKINIGIICTAYSNGSFMNFIKNKLKLPLVIGKTGIKFLFEKSKNFDISVLFESNGHGGVYFNNRAISELQKLNCLTSSSKDAQYLELLNVFMSMFNQVIYIIKTQTLIFSYIRPMEMH